jgi:hypothetical protein
MARPHAAIVRINRDPVELHTLCYQALAELLYECNPPLTQWVSIGPVPFFYPFHHARGTGFFEGQGRAGDRGLHVRDAVRTRQAEDPHLRVRPPHEMLPWALSQLRPERVMSSSTHSVVQDQWGSLKGARAFLCRGSEGGVCRACGTQDSCCRAWGSAPNMWALYPGRRETRKGE